MPTGYAARGTLHKHALAKRPSGSVVVRPPCAKVSLIELDQHLCTWRTGRASGGSSILRWSRSGELNLFGHVTGNIIQVTLWMSRFEVSIIDKI
jgi:hypothetical protein